jgi:enoyl-CoA hydratase/carnithine racemase
MNQTYRTLHVSQDQSVLWVTFDHGDINLLDIEMIREIDQLSHELEAEETCNVVVFQSSNPEFFIAHADVDLIRSLGEVVEKPKELNLYVAALERIRKLPMASIGKIAGIARGGGSEFLLSLDMRFAAIGPTTLSQPEVALGIFPTGSGSQRLPRLLGRARALEVALGCEDYDALKAERYGYINRALPAAELDDFVSNLAYRIASFPREAIAATKQAMDYLRFNYSLKAYWRRSTCLIKPVLCLSRNVEWRNLWRPALKLVKVNSRSTALSKSWMHSVLGFSYSSS